MNNVRIKPLVVVSFVCILFIVTLFFALYISIGAVIVKGSSMENTIHEGDRFLTNEFAYTFQKPAYNDIVILDAETVPGHELYIKRVVGLPGDHLQLKNHSLYRNGKVVHEHYIKEKMNIDFFDVTVPKKHIFVMGDNRNHSADSRVFKTIDYKKEVKAIVIYPLTKEK